MSMCFDVVALSSHPTREPYELCFGKSVLRDSFLLLNVTRNDSKGPAMVLTTFTANSRPDKSQKSQKKMRIRLTALSNTHLAQSKLSFVRTVTTVNNRMSSLNYRPLTGSPPGLLLCHQTDTTQKTQKPNCQTIDISSWSN